MVLEQTNFVIACLDGNLESAKNEYNNNEEYYKSANEFGFKTFYGDKYEEINIAFMYSCTNGHLEVAKWLYSLKDKPDIHAYNESAFSSACANGHLEVAKWLYSLEDKPNININNEHPFEIACCNGHLEVAKWLYSLEDKPDIHINNDKVFKLICRSKNIDLIKWLAPLYDNYYVKIKNNKLMDWEIKDNSDDDNDFSDA